MSKEWKPLPRSTEALYAFTRDNIAYNAQCFEMVLRKLLIGKKQDIVGTTFQSFNDSGELSLSNSAGASPDKPSTMMRGGLNTSGTRPEDVAEQPRNLSREQRSSAGPQRSVLRAPSFDLDDGMDEHSSGSEFSIDDSSPSYDDDEIPAPFHMSNAETFCAPAQFVVPILMDNEAASENQNEGVQLESSLLYFCSLSQDEDNDDSVHSDNTQSKDVLAELPANVDDVSSTSKPIEMEHLKPRKKERRTSKKQYGSRVKRKEMRPLKSKQDPGSTNESDEVLTTNDQLEIDKVPARSESVVPETAMCNSPCNPRSPSKTLRSFKRTGSTLTPKSRSNHSATLPADKPLRPLNGDITYPKTNEELPILNPLDGTNPLTTPVQYTVDLHRQSPVKQRQTYVLGDTMTALIPCAETGGFISDMKQPVRPRRQSIHHTTRPLSPRPQRGRSSSPVSDTHDDDDRDAEQAFERVMRLIDSHNHVEALDSTINYHSTRKKKPTVEDMKRKVKKDRERHEERKRHPTNHTRGAAMRLQSPHRRSKGRTARRQGQLVSTVSYDPTKEHSVM
jgi:hypothetical protein